MFILTKTSSFVFACMWLLANLVFAQSTMTASRVSTPIVIDGQANDWDDAEMQFEARDYIKYNFANDGKTLYLCLQTTDELTQIKLIHGGVQWWLDSTGKKKKIATMQFPMRSKEPLFDRKLRKPNSEDELEDAANQLNVMRIYQRNADQWREMQLTGFYPPLAGVQPLSAKGVPQVRIAWSKTGTLVYEAAIPLALFCATVLKGKDPTMAIGFRIPGFDLPQNAGNNPNSVTNPGGGMVTGRMMTDMRGPRPMATGPSFTARNVEVWTKVRLNR